MENIDLTKIKKLQKLKQIVSKAIIDNRFISRLSEEALLDKINGVNVWPRQPCADKQLCPNIDAPSSCCPIDGSVNCPAGTQHCDAQPGYCYWHEKDQMVSTYFIPDYDKCPSDSTSTKTNLSYQIAGVNVWPRQGCADKKLCPNIDAPNSCKKKITGGALSLMSN